ncbi:MAG TPA: AraC family transcriptional regulator [Pyrinomonadaceae bacterium]|jgi:AraC family transcriptional regulator
MAQAEPNLQFLKAGEHYGKVFCKTNIPSAIISESVYQKSLALPEHSHELAFFTLILQGNYSEHYGGKTFVYSPMTVLWRHSNLSHRDRIERSGSRFFFVEIKRAYLDRLLEYEKVPEHLFEQNGNLAWLAARLRSEVLSNENCSPLVAEGITLEMLGNLARKNAPAEKRPPRWLARVVEKLNAEFAENLSAEDLAAEAGVHPVYLASVFRRFYHETIGEYVQKLRVAHASKMLSDKEIPLCEIAYCAGFSDQSHLTRIFKRLTGITPGAFRDSLD